MTQAPLNPYEGEGSAWEEAKRRAWEEGAEAMKRAVVRAMNGVQDDLGQQGITPSTVEAFLKRIREVWG